MTEHLYAAFSEDIQIRTEGLEHESRDGYRVAVREIAPGVIYDSGGVRVTAFLVNHGEWREAYGYRFDTPGRSVVFSGDTRPSDELVRMATGVDVLVHEVVPSDTTRHPGHNVRCRVGALRARVPYDRAAARRAGGDVRQPKLLVVSHNGRRAMADRILADVRRSFSGPVVIAVDLQRF